uniref:Uncharacterized protein n=1 Tax=Anguilla anguilla TaxID=7936 RepID=A0A0E9V352_ANGAN
MDLVKSYFEVQFSGAAMLCKLEPETEH